MERRRFLQLCTATAAVGVAGSWALPRAASAPWRIDGSALFPGAPIDITLAAHTPPGARLRVCVQDRNALYPGEFCEVAPGAGMRVETPYPHKGLVPGSYRVTVELHSRRGPLLECAEVGGYVLTRTWFSA